MTYEENLYIVYMGNEPEKVKELAERENVSLVAACLHCLDGLVVKASASRAEDPGFESRDFSGSSHTSDAKIDTPVATLPGASRYRVSTGTGRPGVSILGEVESLICNFYLNVAVRKIV